MNSDLGRVAGWSIVILLLTFAVPVVLVGALVTFDRRWWAAFVAVLVARWVIVRLYRKFFPQMVAVRAAQARTQFRGQAEKLLKELSERETVEDRAVKIVEQRTGWPAYMAERHQWDQAVEQAKREMDGRGGD